MKNLITYKEETLESLPTYTPTRFTGKGWNYSHGNDYPYNKVSSFLHSRVGTNWDDVVSEFIHKEWVPVRYRIASKLKEKVEVNTFMKDSKVCFYNDYYWRRGHSEQCVENLSHELFYVHPDTKVLCLFIPKKIVYKKRYAEEQAKTMRILGDYHQLLKIDGIWYEVKGEPVKSDVVVIDGLHYRPAKYFSVEKRVCQHIKGHVVEDKPKCKIVDGKMLVPVDSYWRSKVTKIGPKDRLILNHKQGSFKHDSESVKIILYRQLNGKELKKHGLTNTYLKSFGRCDKCGGNNCRIHNTEK